MSTNGSVCFKRFLPAIFSVKQTYVADSFETFEFMDVRLRNCQSVRILIVYRPPNNTSCALFFEEFSRLLEHVLSEPLASLMIAGDLNFHMENSNNALTRHFTEILETFDLKQHVLSATHASGHTLDLLITRLNEELVRNVKIHDPMISDHLAVFYNLSLKDLSSGRKLSALENCAPWILTPFVRMFVIPL